MWRDTQFTSLFGLAVPIVQGPLGNGYSPPALVAKVSEAGGLGSLGAYGYSPEQLAAAIRELQQRTARPFAVNTWVPRADEGRAPPDTDDWQRALDQTRSLRTELGLADGPPPAAAVRHFEAQVEVILELRPPVFSFIFGVPAPEVLAACRARGIKTIGTATNVVEARELERAGVDAVCASGAEAGGHRGLFLGTLADALIGTMALVPLIRDAIALPVIAAGGIADGRGIAAAFALGADAVQIGTAFLAADESGASAEHRALLRELGQHTLITSAFSGRPGRAIRNRLQTELDATPAAILPFPYQNDLTLPIRHAAAALGRVDLQTLWAGQIAPLAKQAPAELVLQRLIDQTEQVFARLKSL